MPQLVFNIKSKVDTDQVLSAKELRTLFLAGIPMDKLDIIPDDTIDFFINAATNFVEQQLTIKLNKQIITEDKDFDFANWQSWNHLPVTYPASFCISLTGYLNTVKQVDYPASWVTCRKTSDGVLYSRNMAIVPTQSATQSQLIIYTGLMPNAGYFSGREHIPNYWSVQYVTGFDNIPQAIIQTIGMIAAIQVLMIVSDMIVKGNKNYPGIGFGISSNSISLDGLSQNTGAYTNGQYTVFSAKIKQYQDQLMNPDRGLLPSLRDYYGGIINLGC